MTFLPKPIHPFPARMAPEIAFEEAASLPKGALILDPMVGSGTVMRIIAEQGHKGIAFDLDPLAVLMARVWTNPISLQALQHAKKKVIDTALNLNDNSIRLPWIDDDYETKSFIDYWFGKHQQSDLRKLSYVLQTQRGAIGDVLRIALSRIIITKDHGASLARDVSHSRPHRAYQTNDYPVMSEFQRSLSLIISRIRSQPPPGNVTVTKGDARRLNRLGDSTIDAIITSPPYLNAIDYMRGHKFSLVWFGHQIKDLRLIRQKSIGAERGLNANTNPVIDLIYQEVPQLANLPERIQRIVNRYISDLTAMLREFSRVLKIKGKAVLVVGNSYIKDVFVENARIIAILAEQNGLNLLQCRERELPPNKRYLPPPSGKNASTLEKRMRTETVLTFVRS